jgi:hypothetical protein
MSEEYITMSDEIMKERWVIQGPLLELNILSLVKKPKELGTKNISKEQLLENRHNFLMDIIFKIKEMYPVIEILEDDKRIGLEIELLNNDKLLTKNGLNHINMKVFINIGFKRKGRITISKFNDDIIDLNIMYVDDDYRFKHTKELKRLLNKMLKSLNGICGSIGHENVLKCIINVEQLLYDNNIYGFYNVTWNNKVKMKI